MFSDRTPRLLEPSDWARRLEQRRRSREWLADLTSPDPVRAGLAPLHEAAACLAAVGAGACPPEPLGQPVARRAVAAMLTLETAPVEAADVALTPSTSESYAHLFRLFCNPGEGVAVPVPGYPLFEPIARAEGVVPHAYRLEWDGAWHLDRDSVSRALAASRALLTVEPAFPTGAVLGDADRAWLAAECAARGVPIVADEVFRVPGTAGQSWLAGTWPLPVVVLGGLSKCCGLPQLKLAWSVFRGPSDVRDEALERFAWLEDLFLGAATPVQLALPGLLELRHGFRARLASRLAANAEPLAAFLARHPEATAPGAGASWSQVLRLPGRLRSDEWALAALEHGVALHSGEGYDLAPGSHVVASRIAPTPEFAAALEALGRMLRDQPA